MAEQYPNSKLLILQSRGSFRPPFLLSSLPPTWCREGRLPPRLCHVTWAWGCPETRQFRSSVCPSATCEEDDSIRTGGVTPSAGDRGQRVNPQLGGGGEGRV